MCLYIYVIMSLYLKQSKTNFTAYLRVLHESSCLNKSSNIDEMMNHSLNSNF